ncbi:MAG: agmatine deiminase family protein [Candidatus Zixiibacteriota bacterium]
MHLRLRLVIIITLLLTAAVLAEEIDLLPIELTPDEMGRLDEIGINHIITDAPTGEIRNPAEWEPSQGVIIRWPLGIPVSLIAEMSEDIVVTTIVETTYQQNSAISSYTSGGVNMSNVNWLFAATNSIWTRDYGPWFIIDGNDSLAIVDHMYNRPRPLDDQIPWILGADWGLEVYGMDLEHTGGNHMSDGLGVSMSTELVYEENPSLTESEVDSIMLAFLGNDYTVLDYIESGGIHHIDCWAKFLNPTTILVKDVPPSSSSYALLNARANYLSQQISSWGRPYSIVRIYCPTGTAYTNSIILNNKVFVPTFSDSYDDSALQTYANAMPGYEIHGFDGTWYDDDAIHCRTMGVPDRDMLEIMHIPLFTTGDTLNNYEVVTTIKARSGQPLIGDSLKIIYQDRTAFWKSAPLTATGNPNEYVGYIPAQRPRTTVNYYIKAADQSGRVVTHPYIGQPWAHSFYVNHGPTITSPADMECVTSQEFTWCPAFTDPDDAELTISYGDLPAWLSVAGDSVTGTAPELAVVEQFTVTVSDPYSSTEQLVTLTVTQGFLCGDANGDLSVNVADAVYIINYIFKSGPPPDPIEAADVNGDGSTNVGDAVYLINYIFNSGPSPACL